MKTLRGIATSRGIAIGPAFHFQRADLSFERRTVEERVAEWTRFQAAIETACEQLADVYAKAEAESGAEQAAIFQGQAMMLEDPELLEAVRATIEQGYVNAGLFLKRWFELDSHQGVPEHLLYRYGENADKRYPYSAAANSDGEYPPSRPCAKTAGDRLKRDAIKAANQRIPKVFLLWHSPWCWIAWASLILLLVAGWAWFDGRQLNLVQTLQDAITQGLRRRSDVLRGVLERTRGDLTNSLRQQELQDALRDLERQLMAGGEDQRG